MPVTPRVTLRDTSPNARAELEALVRRYGGEPVGAGAELWANAPSIAATQAIFAALEADPRVISNEERAVEAAQQRLAEHQAEQEAARKADREAQLQAENAELRARVAELEAK
jgi:hypothetical protein